MEPRVFTRGNPRPPGHHEQVGRGSMEPRVFTRGNILVRTSERGLPMLQWSHASSRVETTSDADIVCSRDIASMEPRVFTRGNLISISDSCSGNELLQWSHASSRVETRAPVNA